MIMQRILKELATATTTEEANQYLAKGWVLKAIFEQPKEFIMARYEEEPRPSPY